MSKLCLYACILVLWTTVTLARSELIFYAGFFIGKQRVTSYFQLRKTILNVALAVFCRFMWTYNLPDLVICPWLERQDEWQDCVNLIWFRPEWMLCFFLTTKGREGMFSHKAEIGWCYSTVVFFSENVMANQAVRMD